MSELPFQTYTDEQLVQLTLQQDLNSFQELLQRYQAPIFHYCLRLLNFHQADAEDATSETFLKAYTNLNGFNPALKFSSWLYRIAHNEAVNIIKKKSHYFTAELETLDRPITFDVNQPNKTDLDALLNRLKLDDRDILTLFYLEDKSLKQIAEIYKITENAATVRLNRARNRAKALANPQSNHL